MPFGEYTDFNDCVNKNQDKESPEGYCAMIHKKITGKYPSEKQNFNEEDKMVKTAKELLKEQILSLDKKAKLYKELYDEDPMVDAKKEEEKVNEEPEKKIEGLEPENKIEGMPEEKSDIERLVETMEAFGKRLEALENPAPVEKKEDIKVDEPLESAVLPELKPIEQNSDNINKEAQEIPKEEEPKKEAVEEEPKKETLEEEPKKEAIPTEGEIKKETEDVDEEEEKKPIPPVMEKLRLKNIKIESTFKPMKNRVF